MSALSFALIFALTTVLLAEFVNGWTDAPNVIAVVVSTGVMSPKTAILMAVLMNTAGAMSGTAVATTVGKGIVDPAVSYASRDHGGNAQHCRLGHLRGAGGFARQQVTCASRWARRSRIRRRRIAGA